MGSKDSNGLWTLWTLWTIKIYSVHIFWAESKQSWLNSSAKDPPREQLSITIASFEGFLFKLLTLNSLGWVPMCKASSCRLNLGAAGGAAVSPLRSAFGLHMVSAIACEVSSWIAKRWLWWARKAPSWFHGLKGCATACCG